MALDWEPTPGCEMIPTTIEEVKILMENFLKNLLGSDKNGEDEDGLVGIKDNYDEIFSKHEEILVYLQGIRDNLLKTQQKSWVVSITSNEISKTFTSKENTLKKESSEEKLKEIQDLIEKWIMLRIDIDTCTSEELSNRIQRMLLIIR